MAYAKGVGQSSHHHVNDLGVSHASPGSHGWAKVAASAHYLNAPSNAKVGVPEQNILGG